MYGTKTTALQDPVKVERVRLRCWARMQRNMYELAKHVGPRGGSHVYAKWLQDSKGDDVERLDVAQSTPPLMVAKLLLATASLHVDEKEVRDWVAGNWDVSVALCRTKTEE